MVALFAICSVVSASYSFDIQSDISEFEWNEFKTKFNKKYETEAEHNLRQKYYLENKYNILKHNAKYNSGKATNSPDAPSFTLGLNEYCKFCSK